MKKPGPKFIRVLRKNPRKKNYRNHLSQKNSYNLIVTSLKS